MVLMVVLVMKDSHHQFKYLVLLGLMYVISIKDFWQLKLMEDYMYGGKINMENWDKIM